MKFVEFSYEQQTATNGGPFMENRMMNLIREGRDIALAGSMPEQRHLRYAVMTGRLAARVIGSMVDFGCDPSDAMDYCVSPKMVRTLVKLGGNPSKLTYFDHPCFVHECTIDASNEEKFRKPRLLFKTFRQRILLGGVFPAHFADWYDEFLNTGWEDDTSDEFLAFRDLYKAKVGRRYSLYKMTVEFARYTKFLPVKVFFLRHFESVSARVCGVVEAPRYGMCLVSSSRSDNVRGLRRVLEKIVDVEHRGITRMIMAFL